MSLSVLSFCDYYGPGNGGGAERVARQLNQRLSLEHRIQVIAAVPQPFADEAVPVVAVAPRDLTKRLGIQLAIAPGLAEAALTAAQRMRPDLIHAHGLHFQGTVLAARLARRLSIPLIVTVHLASIDLLQPLVRRATAAYERTVGWAVLRQAAAVVAVSGAVRSHCIRRGVSAGRVHVIRNAVDDAFGPSAEPVREVPIVMYVGRLIEDKGVMHLLEASAAATARGAEHQLVFVGDGPMRSALAARAHALGVQPEFRGVTDRVADHMRQANVVVLPSRREGFGLVVAEAQRSRRCVLVSDLASLRELVVPSVSGLVHPPGDVARLAADIERVVRDARLRALLAGAGYRSSLALDWLHAAAQYSALYYRVVPHKLRRAS